MRHKTWDEIIDWTSRMAQRYGGTVYDNDVGKTWDWGQALARQVYDEDWMHNNQFITDDSKPNTDPAPQAILTAAHKWEHEEWPEWARVLARDGSSKFVVPDW